MPTIIVIEKCMADYVIKYLWSMICSLYCLQKAKVEELQSIISRSAKERLWLERQISIGDSSRSPSPQVLAGDLAADIKKKTERLKLLEDENNNLKSSMTQLQKAEAESLKLVRLTEWATQKLLCWFFFFFWREGRGN